MARRRHSSARRRREAVAAFKDKAPAPAAKPAQPATPSPAAARLEPADDGPKVISCPQCGKQYRVPPAAMSRKLTCKNCTRTFIPKAATRSHGRNAARRNNTSTYVALGAVAVGAIVIGIIIANLGPVELETAPQAAPTAKSVDIGWSNPRVQKVVAWANAVHDKDTFLLSRSTDTAAIQAFLAVELDRPILNQPLEQRAEVEKIVLGELINGEKSQILRDFSAQDAQLDEEAMATSPAGTVLLRMPPREGTVYAELAQRPGLGYTRGMEAQVRVSFRWRDPDVLVTGWETVRQPPKPRERKGHKPHEVIPQPVVSERKFGGQTIQVAESELVPLDHLPDTPPELRQEIDDLIAALIDLDAPGAVSNRSINRLVEIGRPAIPRLLTKLTEVEPTGDGKLQLLRVLQALRTMSGARFGFNPADRKELLVGGTKEERLSALKQWYAWWYKNHDRDFTSAIDKEDDESLFLTEKEKQARKAQAAEAAKKKK